MVNKWIGKGLQLRTENRAVRRMSGRILKNPTTPQYALAVDHDGCSDRDLNCLPQLVSLARNGSVLLTTQHYWRSDNVEAVCEQPAGNRELSENLIEPEHLYRAGAYLDPTVRFSVKHKRACPFENARPTIANDFPLSGMREDAK
jgi:hypothetical protein